MSNLCTQNITIFLHKFFIKKENMFSCINTAEENCTLQRNTPVTTRAITTKMIIVVIHVLIHQFIRFCCKSYLKTGNLLLQK